MASDNASTSSPGRRSESAEHLQALPDAFRLEGVTLRGVISHGPLAITYHGLDEATARPVIVKEYFPAEFALRQPVGHGYGEGVKLVPRSRQDEAAFQTGLALFRNQARLLSSLKHPNIARVEKLIEAHNTACMIMPREKGKPLTALIDLLHGRADVRALRALVLPLLSALFQVHRAGYLHRDVKPDNILVRENGQPLLLDFGISLPEGASGKDNFGRAGTSFLTPGFAALEQYWAGGVESPATDLYAVAATLFLIVTGKPPRDAVARAQEVAAGGTESPGDRAQDLGRGRFPDSFLRAIDRGLSLHAGERFASADDFARALRRDDGDSVAAGAVPREKEPVAPEEYRLAEDDRPENGREWQRPTEPPVHAADVASSSQAILYDAIGPTIAVDRIACLPGMEQPGPAPVPAGSDQDGAPGNLTPEMLAPDSQAKAGRKAAGTREKHPRRSKSGKALLLGGLIVLGGVGLASSLLTDIWSGVRGHLLATWRYATDTPWLVDPSGEGDSETISEALGYVFDETTIFILPGEYPESLQMQDRILTLRGLGDAPGDVRIAPVNAACLLAQGGEGRLVLSNLSLKNSINRSEARQQAGNAASLNGESMDLTRSCLILAGGTAKLEKIKLSSGGGSGLLVQDAASVHWTDGDIVGAARFGIEMRQPGSSELSGLQIRQAGKSGLLVDGNAGPDDSVSLKTSRIELSKQAGILAVSARLDIEKGDIIRNRGNGLESRGLSEVTVTESRIADQAAAGIYSHHGASLQMVGNRVEGNRLSGLVLGGPGEADIQANVILLNREHGVLLLAGSRGRLTGNDVQDNGFFGIATDLNADFVDEDNKLAKNRGGDRQEGEAPRPAEGSRSSGADPAPPGSAPGRE